MLRVHQTFAPNSKGFSHATFNSYKSPYLPPTVYFCPRSKLKVLARRVGEVKGEHILLLSCFIPIFYWVVPEIVYPLSVNLLLFNLFWQSLRTSNTKTQKFDSPSNIQNHSTFIILDIVSYYPVTIRKVREVLYRWVKFKK